MVQQQIDTMLGTPEPFVYAMSFHYIPGMYDVLVEEIRQRFEIKFRWKLECSAAGNWHIQACGQTMRQVDDKYRKKFQKGGIFSKCLRRKGEYNPEQDESLKKPYSIALARKSWADNVSYVFKPFEETPGRVLKSNLFIYGTSEPDLLAQEFLDAENKTAECAENRALAKKRKLRSSLEHRLRDWYESIPLPDRPIDDYHIVSQLYDAKVIPCGQFTPQVFARAAHYIQNRYVHQGTDSPYKKNFLELVYKHLR